MTRHVKLSAMVVLALATTIVAMPAAQGKAELTLRAAREAEAVKGDLKQAAALYEQAVAEAGAKGPVAAHALVGLGRTGQKLGRADAPAVLARVVRDFADQPTAVAAARVAIDAARPATAAQTTVVRRVVYQDPEWAAVAVSPDGRYAVGRAFGTTPLMLRTLPAKDDRALFPQTDTSAIVGPPVFSPNGAMAAFVWVDLQGDVRSTSIAVIGTSPNATPRRITPAVAGNVNRIAPVAWSADASSVIVRTAEFASGRMTASTLDWVSVASGTTTKSIPFSIQNESPVMSPSGDYFAFEKARAAAGPVTESRIYTIDGSSGNETEVVRIAGKHRSPVWTPDGSAILFLSNRTGREGLWAVRIQNGQAAGEEVLVQDSLASGVLLAGVTVDGTVYLRETQPERQHVFISERGVPGARGFRAFNGEGVSWSPDGASVAFIKNDGTDLNNALIIKNLATGDERPFDHPNHLGNAQVRWSGDGSSILVSIRGAGLHVFDVRSGQFRQIPATEGRVRGGVADISPDGKTIYVASRPAGGAATGVPFTDLVSVDVVTGAERRLADLGALGHGRAWGVSPGIAVSPDGQYVALQVGQAVPPVVTLRLALVAVDGSGSRFLSGPYRMDNIVSTITWTPDGQSVLFFTGNAQQTTFRLMRVSAGSGEPVFDGLERATLRNDPSLPALAPFPPHSLTVSPDGSRVAFGVYAGRSSQLVALDNVNAVIASAR